MKRFSIIIMLLMPLAVFCITRNVALDGTQSYISIQTAINEAQSGDMILVHPGRYMENIDISGKSDITLASFEYTTADTSYISSTIIDGSAGNTSTIICYEYTNNCTISGFSITGGQGYDFHSGQVPYQITGGGIIIYKNNSITIKNLNVFGNHAASGGGISIGAPNSVLLSGVNIYNNYARYLGGGIGMGSHPTSGEPNLIFSQINRCSIYNNFAEWGMDIHWHYTHGGTLDIYLKKFTVPQWEKYFADYFDYGPHPSPYTVFDIQEAYLEPLDADFYVSPDGDDDNDGLGPASPLKTPALAMQRIASNPQNPRTVHLMAGEHHNLFGGEYLAIAIKDYTSLQGVSESQSRIYAENMISGTAVITMGTERYGMKLKNLSISTSNAAAIYSWDVFDCLLENVCIENCTVDHYLFFFGQGKSTYTMKNITMRGNTSTYSNFGLALSGRIITLDKITMIDNQTPSLPVSEFNQRCGGFDIDIFDKLTIRNSKFINNTHYSVDGLANFRVSGWSRPFVEKVLLENCLFAFNHTYGGARDIRLTKLAELNIVNCTFVNNVGTYPDFLLTDTYSNRIVNSIFSNNNAAYDIAAVNNTVIENCLFSKTNNIYRTYDGLPLNWGLDNIIGTDPLFSGTDPALASSYCLFSDEINGYSPAIDAGTTDPAILPYGYTIPQYDVFGFHRLYGNGIDIGCCESQGYTGVEEETIPAVAELQLSNYPNPFNPSTTISYSVPANADIRLEIYNAKGQLVNALVNEYKEQGKYQIVWSGKDKNGNLVSSGIYFSRVASGGKSLTRKMLLMK
ncbi:MAG: T9SS type A sorting domain-containing protein [Candidatus Cloacimonetes bacterium]|nr:T9SS type A sorting domain-containing protein [Candidatus Cloacimonadota bacterium]MDY0172354.1 T9SS type A sorting domain-containing protein [Candidatus Cloacimonadaceae bacterium]